MGSCRSGMSFSSPLVCTSTWSGTRARSVELTGPSGSAPAPHSHRPPAQRGAACPHALIRASPLPSWTDQETPHVPTPSPFCVPSPPLRRWSCSPPPPAAAVTRQPTAPRPASCATRARSARSPSPNSPPTSATSATSSSSGSATSSAARRTSRPPPPGRATSAARSTAPSSSSPPPTPRSPPWSATTARTRRPSRATTCSTTARSAAPRDLIGKKVGMNTLGAHAEAVLKT